MNNSGTSPSSSVGPGRSRSDHIVAVPAGPVRRRRRTGPVRPRNEGRRPTIAATVTELCRLCDTLTAQSSLAPGPLVNELFGRLVELAVSLRSTEADAVLADPEVQAIRPLLQRLCAAGEGELERSWAHRITTSATATDELARFPYLENYRLLVDLEWSAVLGAAGAARPERVAFVGAGPLPLTALLLARHHDVAVDGYDRDRRAVDQGRAVLAALGPCDRLHLRHGDTARCPDLHAYDLVVLAALVGASPVAKRAAIRQVQARMRPGALLAVRSAHAARSLLYPVLELEALGDLELLSVVHPLNQVINSIVLARKWATDTVDRQPVDQVRRATTPVPNNEVRPWPAS